MTLSRKTRLRTYAPLQRRQPMRKRKPRRLSRPGSDPAYLAAVRGLPCYLLACFPLAECEGRIHAHHAGRRPGVGMKAPDDTAIPFCEKHHRQWHDGNGPFRGLNRLSRFSVAEHAVAVTRQAVAALRGRP